MSDTLRNNPVTKTIERVKKNPLMAAIWPIPFAWDLLRPAFTKAETKISEIPGKLINLSIRSAIGIASAATRAAIHGMLRLPLLPMGKNGSRNLAVALGEVKENLTLPRPKPLFPPAST